uniref:Uncharacterized protein n=1 Tax=Nelumbo nucifera TaxID=4432 RepID=A0A822XTF6_NELNU|nr:TPA_asm: hypothetical protein HUJ06_023912 [Nelumbo nucifera]
MTNKCQYLRPVRELIFLIHLSPMSCETNPEPKTASPSSALFFGLGLSDDGGGGSSYYHCSGRCCYIVLGWVLFFGLGLSDDGGGVLFSFTLHNCMSREAAKSSKSISLAKLILGLAKKEKGKDLKVAFFVCYEYVCFLGTTFTRFVYLSIAGFIFGDFERSEWSVGLDLSPIRLKRHKLTETL